MDRWYSSIGRLVMLGDVAHGNPPSIGQGKTQALEDAHSLGLLLGNVEGRVD
jgi:2-polyprenyl-6-methoxyphenol hydroxylase-like FAD-dependent oxidoreductase